MNIVFLIMVSEVCFVIIVSDNNSRKLFLNFQLVSIFETLYALFMFCFSLFLVFYLCYTSILFFILSIWICYNLAPSLAQLLATIMGICCLCPFVENRASPYQGKASGHAVVETIEITQRNRLFDSARKIATLIDFQRVFDFEGFL